MENNITDVEMKILTERIDKRFYKTKEILDKCNLNSNDEIQKNFQQFSSDRNKNKKLINNNQENNDKNLTTNEIDILFQEMNKISTLKKSNSIKRTIKKQYHHGSKLLNFKSSSVMDITKLSYDSKVSMIFNSTALSMDDLRNSTTAKSELTSELENFEVIQEKFHKLSKSFSIPNFDDINQKNDKNFKNSKEYFNKLNDFLGLLENKLPGEDKLIKLNSSRELERLIERFNDVSK